MVDTNQISWEADLKGILPPGRIRMRYIDLVSYASDAGFYYLLPKAVVQPADEAEVIALFAFSRRRGIPLVFRTGGTSLSGQSITDGILVDLSIYWRKATVTDGGAHVRVQPGITGAAVNAMLRRHRRKIGPDPSSISAAMMGGIISNNASGMCCGVVQNAYHTARHLRFILPNGHAYTTERGEDRLRFAQEQKPLHDALLDIRRGIHGDPGLSARIREKFRTKTTIGYSLNAFLDYAEPLDILARLLVGAEGTLAFISEAVMETVPDHPHKSTAMLYFPDIHSACQAIRPLTDAGAAMAELMDRASLRAVQDLPGMPPVVKTLPDTAAALLIEFQEATMGQLADRVDHFLGSCAGIRLLHAPSFTEDPAEQDFLWKVRKGLFPAVGAVRARGTTVILEDIAFPVDALADAVSDLQELFRRYAYDNAIIFGHAKDGNIHFVITQDFDTSSEVDRYDRFMREVVAMVVTRYGGTLKAEHGTGRNMAPFVETEWGGDAYAIIRRIKRVVDPGGLLNPGVIVNDDPEVHLRNLKRMPVVEEEVDRCIECGYCEHRCPSRDITATPRRRIVVRRVLKNLEQDGNMRDHRRLLEEYRYDGLETCAVDGLCATACPVDINTGELVKRLRREEHSAAANRTALFIAGHFGSAMGLVRMALQAGSLVNGIFGKRAMSRLTVSMRKLFPGMPAWPLTMPAAPSLSALQPHIRDASGSSAQGIVYYPACITRAMGTYPGKEKDLMQTLLSVCRKVGIDVFVPKGIAGSCCSQIFSSKGYADACRFTANKLVDELWDATDGGRLPVVTDVSSCAYTMLQMRPSLDAGHRERYDALRIMDSVDLLHDIVLPRLGADALCLDRSIVLHPVCSLEKMKTGEKLLRVAQRFAREVVVPAGSGCCGMAGDRGFLFPELTASATLEVAATVAGTPYDGYHSSTRTCEMALSEAVKKDYTSILYLADEAIQTATT